MKDEKTVLEPEVLENIKPFSGDADEMTPGERLITEGKALQKTQTQYVTAVKVQEPRSIAKITNNVLAEAKLAGAGFYFRWPVKNKRTGVPSIIQGPSIDLAMCVARNYGNCVIDIEGTETPTHFMFKGIFIDLETGFTVPRLFRQRKGQDIGGGYGDDRSEDIVFQIGQSKVQRNAIIKAMPIWLIEQAIDVARQAEIDKIKPENLALARAKVIAFFEPYGITQDQIEQKMERKADEWTAKDIADLRGMATGLKEGRTSAQELFPKEEAAEVEEEKPTETELSTEEEKPTETELSTEEEKPTETELSTEEETPALAKQKKSLESTENKTPAPSSPPKFQALYKKIISSRGKLKEMVMDDLDSIMQMNVAYIDAIVEKWETSPFTKDLPWPGIPKESGTEAQEEVQEPSDKQNGSQGKSLGNEEGLTPNYRDMPSAFFRKEVAPYAQTLKKDVFLGCLEGYADSTEIPPMRRVDIMANLKAAYADQK